MGRVEHLAVLLTMAAAMFAGLGSVRFHPDESHWIGLSAPFEAFFTGRFTDPIWQTRQDRYMNAPITYYVVGAARRAGGWTPESLNPPYRFGRPHEENLAEGRIPEPGLLWWSRAGVTAAVAAGIFGAFVVFARAAGRPAAYLWLALVLIHPYLRETLRRAMNEGVLLSMLSLAIWATYRLLGDLHRSVASRSRWGLVGWTTLAGAAAGLAAGTKANGGFALLGIGIVLAMAAARHPAPAERRAKSLVAAALVLTIAAASAYVGTNPTLWPNPARGAVEMLRTRTQVLAAQMVQFPQDALPALSQRVRIASERVFCDYALLPRTVTSIVLFLAGALITAGRLYLWVLRRNDNHALVALAVVGVAVSAPAFVSPLDWPRYYVLPVFFFSLPIVLGMDWLARRVWHALSVARSGR